MADFSIIWAVIIGFAVIMYVVLDGFDLGVGILLPFLKDHKDRDKVINSIVPFWDGNETWLVLGGISLFAAFPKAYAELLPKLYLPLILFLLGLILRGASFEFRYKETKRRYIWDWSFALGSITAAFMQGAMAGSFIGGLPLASDTTSSLLFTFTPFNIVAGIALVLGYALLGATWLIIKTEHDLQEWCRKIAIRLMPLVIFAVVMLSLWTSYSYEAVRERWFSWPNIIYLSPIPFYVSIVSLVLYLSLRKRSVYLPFMCGVALFVISFIGLTISFWPYIIPWEMTIWDAASPPESQAFMLTGVVFLLPVILFYTIHAYWVFRGKVQDDMHY